MKHGKSAVKRVAAGKALRSAVVVLIGGSMMTAAGLAVGGKPVPGGATAVGACSVFEGGSLFFDACIANVAVAKQLGTTEGYIGSCEGGGACADSVYNKLISAASKFAVPKISDGCANLATIQSDLLAWHTSTKPKINGSGNTVMTSAIHAIQVGNCP